MSGLRETRNTFRRRLLTSFRSELFGFLETKVSKYEKDIERNRKLLDQVSKLKLKRRRADVQQMSLRLEQQDSEICVDQEESEHPRVKEEEEELLVADGDDGAGHGSHGAKDKVCDETRKDPERSFHCSICEKTYTQKRKLMLHMRTHSGQKLVTCSACDQSFMDKDTLKRHMLIHRKQTKDHSVFSKLGGGGFVKHESGRMVEKPRLHCSVCQSSFSEKKSLIRHMRIHSRQTQFSCLVCGKEFVWRRYLTKHMEIHADEKIDWAVCDGGSSKPQRNEEGGASTSESSGDDCVRSGPGGNPGPDEGEPPGHEDKEAFDFSEADSDDNDFWKEKVSSSQNNTPHNTSRSWMRRDDLQKIHSGGKSLGDSEREHDIFNTGQRQGEELSVIKEEQQETDVTVKSEQQELHHLVEETRDNCGGQESGPGGHSESNTQVSEPDTDDSDFWSDSVKPKPCPTSVENNDVCEGDVSLKPSKKPYICSTCGKRFPYLHVLQNHMKSHGVKKVFFCPECGRNCSFESQLKSHMRSHTGEKPYSCHVCGTKFTSKANLQKHVSVHATEKPHNCSICHQSFAWFTQLKYHQCVTVSLQENTRPGLT